MPARIRSAASQLRGAKVKANMAKGLAACAELARQMEGRMPLNATVEFRFHPTRMWRFDLALPTHKIAVEIEGGGWVGGAHSRGAHFESDLEKYAEAAALGWVVLRVSPAMVRDGRAAAWLKRIAEKPHAQG